MNGRSKLNCGWLNNVQLGPQIGKVPSASYPEVFSAASDGALTLLISGD